MPSILPQDLTFKTIFSIYTLILHQTGEQIFIGKEIETICQLKVFDFEFIPFFILIFHQVCRCVQFPWLGAAVLCADPDQAGQLRALASSQHLPVSRPVPLQQPHGLCWQRLLHLHRRFQKPVWWVGYLDYLKIEISSFCKVVPFKFK